MDGRVGGWMGRSKSFYTYAYSNQKLEKYMEFREGVKLFLLLNARPKSQWQISKKNISQNFFHKCVLIFFPKRALWMRQLTLDITLQIYNSKTKIEQLKNYFLYLIYMPLQCLFLSQPFYYFMPIRRYGVRGHQVLSKNVIG
jgi:hypothetical protein